VLDGAGHRYTGELEAYDRDKVQVRVFEKGFTPRSPGQISLVQALPKGKLIESIIQKATELGVSRVLPVWTERTVLQLKAEEAARKQLKWQTTAIEAIKQCGAVWLPVIDRPTSLESFLNSRPQFELSLVGALEGERQHPRVYFEQFRQSRGGMPSSMAFYIGPEGDFTPKEMEALLRAGAQPISLGPLVLRTETAAIYCLSIAQHELQWAATDSRAGAS
jgi:16S rRNA (uracil1498-N3)-methyltransferase